MANKEGPYGLAGTLVHMADVDEATALAIAQDIQSTIHSATHAELLRFA